MSYRIRVPKRVQKELDALPDAVYARVREPIQRLSDDPRPTGVKKLKGRVDIYRIRIGSYRVVFEVDDTAQEVTLITVSERVWQWLNVARCLTQATLTRHAPARRSSAVGAVPDPLL